MKKLFTPGTYFKLLLILLYGAFITSCIQDEISLEPDGIKDTVIKKFNGKVIDSVVVLSKENYTKTIDFFNENEISYKEPSLLPYGPCWVCVGIEPYLYCHIDICGDDKDAPDHPDEEEDPWDGGNDDDNPDPDGNGGGQGTGDNDPDSGDNDDDIWANDLEILGDPVDAIPIDNIISYLKCFKFSEGATLVVYVDQPTPNSTATWSGSATDPDVGHTFLSITQGDITRVFGFYPNAVVIPKAKPSATSVLKDNNGHHYDVKVTLSIDKFELLDIIDAATAYNGTYNLNSYNCSDFAQDICAYADLILPETFGKWPGGGGTNPGNLGQDIRSMSGDGITVIKSSGNAPKNSGNCK